MFRILLTALEQANNHANFFRSLDCFTMESLPRNSSSNLSRNDMLNDDVDVRNPHEDVSSEQMSLAAIASQSYINYPPHCQIMGGPPHGIEGQFQVKFLH